MVNNILHKRMSEVRDLINIPRKQSILLQNLFEWYDLCDSMDTIEDTEKSLEHFLKEDAILKEDVNSYGQSIENLPSYEVLDTLVTQQSAVAKLYETLEIQYNKHSSLEDIRQICIDAMEKATDIGNTKAFNSVDIPELITIQRSILGKDLNNVIKTLTKEELEHRNKFKGKKLSEVFSVTSYWFEKIYEAIISENSPHVFIVGGHVDSILKSVDEFKADLKERGEPDENIADIYENIDYSLKHIKAYFHNNEDTHLKKKDIYIFAYFARRQVRELESIAQDIDEKYNQGYIS